MPDFDPNNPVVIELADALERLRVHRGAEARPPTCVGAPACLEPPRRPDGRVRCATCGHGFPLGRTVFRMPEFTVPGAARQRVVALVADASPITTRAVLRSQPIPDDGFTYRYHGDAASFTPADGEAMPLDTPDPFGPLRVRLADGSELDEHAWKRARWPAVHPPPLPTGAWFERAVHFAQPGRVWLALAGVHLDVDGGDRG